MNKFIYFLIFPIFVILLVPVFAEEETEKCNFTASLEKSWIYYGETPFLTGFVINCDTGGTQEARDLSRDRVHIKLLDINGERIDENWLGSTKYTGSSNPTQYQYVENVYREGQGGNIASDNTKELVRLKPNQYFMYLPVINPLDFHHREAYQIQLTYAEYTKTIWFAVFNPNVYWEDPEYCENAQEKLIEEKRELASMKRQVEAFIEENVSMKNEQMLDISKQEQLIHDLEQCKII